VFIHEGVDQTIVNEFGLADFANEVLGDLKRAPNRVVGTVKIEGYYYVTTATEALAKAACLNVLQVQRVIDSGLTCVWILSEPDRFGSPPLSKSIGKRRGVGSSLPVALEAPRQRFSHVCSKFMSSHGSLIQTTSETFGAVVHRSSWTFEKEFKIEVENALGMLYTSTGQGIL